MSALVPIELVPKAAAASPYRRSIVWGDRNVGIGMDANVDWNFTEFGPLSVPALTFARTGVGMFLADRAVRRNQLRQRRAIHLVVPVPDVGLGLAAADAFAELAAFVTGDDWTFTFEPDPSLPSCVVDERHAAEEVSLLSGGLDSFCGALIGGAKNRLFLSHSDASVIRYSQNQSQPHIPELLDEQVVRVGVTARAPFNSEPSRRSRSILFIAMGVALADASGASSLEVPENGFTSLNPPLAANRGGVLTTRSTHPLTFHLAKEVLARLGLAVDIRNPYEWFTKGDLIAEAVAATNVQTVQAGLASTLSCAKSNLIIPGKKFGRNCGLDYACIVRRAGVRAAGITDTTTYECHDPVLGPRVLEARQGDVRAVELASLTQPTLQRLATSCGPFPPGYDYARGLDLWKRGHSELAGLQLP